jgi:thiosulfate dehydrogenase [quinone] large subunit
MNATRPPDLDVREQYRGNPRFAYLLLRLAVGMSMAIHGLIRLDHGTRQFASELVKQFASSPLPAGLVYLFATCLVWFEALVGILLFFGLFTGIAAAASALEMVVLIFGSALLENWTLVMLQLFYALLFYVLLIRIPDNRYSLDEVRRRNKAG